VVKTKRTASVSKECVACGTCVKVCPRQGISIFKGTIAIVDSLICIGCKKCAQACPANVITMKETDNVEKALV
jgi:formate hydrogenlyase subunit 6/NADH:ubiquinone oxidoreductase subunit I